MSTIKPSVYVSKPWAGPTIHLFSRFGYPIAPTIKSADIVAFNGGEDINPAIYGQKPIPEAHVYWNNDRDKIELDDYANAEGKFKFGICRGGQLLNCKNGGKLWQDVNNHGRAHDMIDLTTNETVYTSSVHHQQFQLGPDAVVLAVAHLATNKIGRDERGRVFIWDRDNADEHDPSYDDPEVVFYPNDKALCIQGHPEYSGYGQFTDYCMTQLERLLNAA